ncbi:RRXRR domain-containing protein [Streptomyces sp. NPDC005571]|uniref:RRXRR domain-containing protein n=1 Tax=Streptomyces sp. NPDC005571 TaxID=3156888 RepID=UPI0033ADA886
MVPLVVEALIPDPLQDVSAIAARQTIELERDPAHIDFQEIRPGPGAGSGLLTRLTITHSSVAGRSRICAVAAIPPTTTNCRYRARKSHNRTRPKGWLPPSVQRRIDTTLATAHRLARYAPVTWIHIEHPRIPARHMGTHPRLLRSLRLVHASISKGKWAGTRTGRISVRASGKHSLSTPVGRCTASRRNLRPPQRADGYAYSHRQEVTE